MFTINCTINGTRYALTRDNVDTALEDIARYHHDVDEVTIETDLWGCRKFGDFFYRWMEMPKRENGTVTREGQHPTFGHRMIVRAQRNATSGLMRFLDSSGTLLAEISGYSVSF